MFAQQEDESVVSKAFTAMLGLGVLAAMGALAYAATLPTASASGARSLGSASIVTQASAASSEQPPQAALEESRDAATAQPSAQQASKEASSAPSKRTKRPRTVGKRIEDPRLIAARREVKVTMYSAPWCFLCDRARTFLNAREVALTDYDVDMDAEASKKLAQLNPQGSIPTFVVDGKVIVGFHPWGLEDAIDRVAQEQFCAKEEAREPAQGAVCDRLVSVR